MSSHNGSPFRTRIVASALPIRQFEFQHSLYDFAVCAGTTNAHAIVTDWTDGSVLGSVRRFGQSNEDPVLGLCWLKQARNSGHFLGGSAAGAIRLVNASIVLEERRALKNSGEPVRQSAAVPDLPVVRTYPGIHNLTCVHVNCDDTLAIFSGYMRDITLRDIETGGLVRFIEDAHTSHVNITRFASTHANIFATCSTDKSVTLWDARSARKVYTLLSDRENITLSFSSGDTYLLSSGVDNEVRAYSVGSGKLHAKMDIQETGRADNFCRAYFCPSFGPGADISDAAALVVSGSSEQSVVRLNEVATGRHMASIPLYDGSKTDPSTLYVQSLRAHPSRPGVIGVIAGSRNPLQAVQLIALEAWGTGSMSADGVEVGRGRMSLSQIGAFQNSGLVLSDAYASRLGTDGEEAIEDVAMMRLTAHQHPPPSEVTAMMWSQFVAAQVQGNNCARVLDYTAYNAFGSVAGGTSIPATAFGQSGADMLLLCGTGASSPSMRVFSHSAILKARIPVLTSLLAERDRGDSSVRVGSPMDLLHLGKGGSYLTGVTPSVLAVLLTYAYFDAFIFPVVVEPVQLDNDGAKLLPREFVRAFLGTGEAEITESVCGSSVLIGTAELLRSSRHVSVLNSRWQLANMNPYVSRRQGPLVVAQCAGSNHMTKLENHNSGFSLTSFDPYVPDEASSVTEGRIMRASAASTTLPTQSDSSCGLTWQPISHSFYELAFKCSKRDMCMLEGVVAGFEAARIGLLPRLAALTVSRMHPGLDGRSELSPLLIIPLLQIACAFHADLSLLLAEGSFAADAATVVEALVSQHSIGSVAGLSYSAWRASGRHGEMSAVQAVQGAATALMVSVLAYALQHYRHLKALGILDGLDDAASVCNGHSDGGPPAAKHARRGIGVEDVRESERGCNTSNAQMGLAVNLLHAMFADNVDSLPFDPSRGPQSTRKLIFGMHNFRAGLTVPLGEGQDGQFSGSIAVGPTSIQIDESSRLRKALQGISTPLLSEAQPFRAYDAAMDPLFDHARSPALGIPRMDLHSAVVVGNGKNTEVVIMGGIGLDQAGEQNMPTRAPIVLQAGTCVSKPEVGSRASRAQKVSSAGVLGIHSISGAAPHHLSCHSAVPLGPQPSRYMLVYPGSTDPSLDHGPGSTQWMPSTTTNAQFLSAAHPAYHEPSHSVPIPSHIVTEEQSYACDSLHVQSGFSVPVVGIPAGIDRYAHIALAHSRVWVLDTLLNKWHAITPSWEGGLDVEGSQFSYCIQGLKDRSAIFGDVNGDARLAALLDCTSCPPPREVHTCVAWEAVPQVKEFGDSVQHFHFIVFGGAAKPLRLGHPRRGATRLYNQVHALVATYQPNKPLTCPPIDAGWTFQWMKPTVTGECSPRFAHASCVLQLSIGNKGSIADIHADNGPIMVVFGGTSIDGSALSDLMILSLEGNAARFIDHSASAGLHNSAMYAKNLAFEWHSPIVYGACPSARSGHTLTSVYSTLAGRPADRHTGNIPVASIDAFDFMHDDIARRTAVMFGGGGSRAGDPIAHSKFNDLYVLAITVCLSKTSDQYIATWSKVQIMQGPSRSIHVQESRLQQPVCTPRTRHVMVHAPAWPISAGPTVQAVGKPASGQARVTPQASSATALSIDDDATSVHVPQLCYDPVAHAMVTQASLGTHLAALEMRLSALPVSGLVSGAFLVFGGEDGGANARRENENKLYYHASFESAIETALFNFADSFDVDALRSLRAAASDLCGHEAFGFGTGPGAGYGSTVASMHSEDAPSRVVRAHVRHHDPDEAINQAHHEENMRLMRMLVQGPNAGEHFRAAAADENDEEDDDAADDVEDDNVQEEENEGEAEDREFEIDADDEDVAEDEDDADPYFAGVHQADEFSESAPESLTVDGNIHALVLSLAPLPSSWRPTVQSMAGHAHKPRYAHLTEALCDGFSHGHALCMCAGGGLQKEGANLFASSSQLQAAVDNRQLLAMIPAPITAVPGGDVRDDAKFSFFALHLEAAGCWSVPSLTMLAPSGFPIPPVPPSTWGRDMCALAPGARELALGKDLPVEGVAMSADVRFILDWAQERMDNKNFTKFSESYRWVLRERFPMFRTMFSHSSAGPSGAEGGPGYSEGRTGLVHLERAPGDSMHLMMGGQSIEGGEQAAAATYDGASTLVRLLYWAVTGGIHPVTGPVDAMVLMAACDEWDCHRLARLAEAVLIPLVDEENVLGLLQFADWYVTGQSAGDANGDALTASSSGSPRVEGPRDTLDRPGCVLRSACRTFILRSIKKLSASPDWDALPEHLRRNLLDEWEAGDHAFVGDRDKSSVG